MTTIFSILFVSITSLSADKHQIGFLLDNNLAVIAFTAEAKGKIIPVSTALAKEDVQDKKGVIFFDRKVISEVRLIDKLATCYKKPTEDEIENNKTREEIECPDQQNAGVIRDYYNDPLVKIKFPDSQKDKITKIVASQKFKLEWGFLNAFVKGRPLLISTNSKMKDPQEWKPIKFSQIPKETQDKIRLEVLKSRSPQKCDEPNSKIAEYKLTSQNLEIGHWYTNKAVNSFAGSFKIINTDDLSLCNGNEMGIPSAYVVVKNGKIFDILKSQDWNYRDLTLIETADLNSDGQSELIFLDNGYNSDGFSVLDLKSMKLVTFADSSH